MVWCGGGDSKDGSGGVECWQKKAMVAMISDNDNVDGGGNNSDDSGVFFWRRDDSGVDCTKELIE